MRSVLERYLGVIGVSDKPNLLVAAVPSLLVGLGLQVFALWRLQPDSAEGRWPG